MILAKNYFEQLEKHKNRDKFLKCGKCGEYKILDDYHDAAISTKWNKGKKSVCKICDTVGVQLL